MLISCGVRANTELAEQMGLKVNRAVAVNEKMQTSEKISACGDCVEFEGEMQRLWAGQVSREKSQEPMQPGSAWNIRKYRCRSPLTV